MDWGNEVSPLPGLTIASQTAHHWSARGLGDPNHARWAAFVLHAAGGSVYFGGNTGFAGGRTFSQTAARYPTLDLALLPTGAYEPRWFMAEQHMNPAEAVEVLSLLAAPQALGYHWGTFQLTDEGAETPAHDLTPQNWKLAHPF